MNKHDFLTGMCAGIALFVVFISVLSVAIPPVSQFGAINKLNEVFPGAKFTVWCDTNEEWNINININESGQNTSLIGPIVWWTNTMVIK